jgi:hypothetical protein
MGLLAPYRIMHSYFCHCHIVLVAGPIPRAMQIQGVASFPVSAMGTQAFAANHSQTTASRVKLYS